VNNQRARRYCRNRISNYWRSVGVLCAAGIGLLCAAAAQSQTTPAPAADELQEVVVTGTLIRGATAPVGSTLIAVDQEELQATGANSIADMLRDVPQVSGLGVAEGQRSGTGGATNITLANSINLRGLSPYATLTLLSRFLPCNHAATS
jgi:iron complex outermembrane recepter protein